MPTARTVLGVGVVNGILYAVGGISAAAPQGVSTVEAYDPTTDTWTTKAPMPTPRNSLTIGVMNGILYAVGGGNSSGFLGTVEAYDPSADTWTTETSMPTARAGLEAGVVNGTLYAVGGFNPTELATNEAFTPLIPFAAFTAKVDINLASSFFTVNSTFTLGSGGSINPLTDPVTFKLAGFSITIPGGSFHLAGLGTRFVFEGTINGVALQANLTPLGGNSFPLTLDAAGASNLPTTNPVTVGLTIGKNTGRISVNAGL